MLAAARAFLSALRSQIDTLQPAFVRACAMPSPMPPLPPVTTATRLVRSNICMGFSRESACVRSTPTMDKAVLKIKYGCKFLKIPAGGMTPGDIDEEAHAVQTRNARLR